MSREVLDRFDDKDEARAFYDDACQSEREGKPVPCPADADCRIFHLTLPGLLVCAGFPLEKPKRQQEICSVCREGLPFPECPCHQADGTCPYAIPDDGE